MKKKSKLKIKIVSPLLLSIGIIVGTIISVVFFVNSFADLTWKKLQEQAELLDGDIERETLYRLSVLNVMLANSRTNNLEANYRFLCMQLTRDIAQLDPESDLKSRTIEYATIHLEWLRKSGYCEGYVEPI